MIQIQDFSFTYKNGENPALQEISLTVPDGGFLGIIGPAGAGKPRWPGQSPGLFRIIIREISTEA